MEASATESDRKRKLDTEPSDSKHRKNRRKLGHKNQRPEPPEANGLSGQSADGTKVQQKRSGADKESEKSLQGPSSNANAPTNDRQEGKNYKAVKHEKRRGGGNDKRYEREQAVEGASQSKARSVNGVQPTKHKRAPQEISSANRQILGSRLSKWSITTSRGGRYLELPALFSASEEYV